MNNQFSGMNSFDRIKRLNYVPPMSLPFSRDYYKYWKRFRRITGESEIIVNKLTSLILDAAPQVPMKILDIGSGDGQLFQKLLASQELQNNLHIGNIYIIEPSYVAKKAYKRISKTIDKISPTTSCYLFRSSFESIENTTLQNEQFHLILATHVIYYLNTLSYTDIERLAAPGGLFICVYDSPASIFYKTWRELAPNIADNINRYEDLFSAGVIAHDVIPLNVDISNQNTLNTIINFIRCTVSIYNNISKQKIYQVINEHSVAKRVNIDSVLSVIKFQSY